MNEDSKQLKDEIEQSHDDYNGIEEVIRQTAEDSEESEPRKFVIYGTTDKLNEPPQREEGITFAYGEITSSKRASSVTGIWELKKKGRGLKPYIKISENLDGVEIIREFNIGNGGLSGITDDIFCFIYHMVVTEGE